MLRCPAYQIDKGEKAQQGVESPTPPYNFNSRLQIASTRQVQFLKVNTKLQDPIYQIAV
jgi:hypothetical protein